MPMFETVCKDHLCPGARRAQEHYYRHADDANMPCDDCGGPTGRLVSRSNAIWLRPLHAYADPRREGYQSQQRNEGHWAFRRRSSRNPDGSPEKVWIRTRQDQKEYCKAEGYLMPDEIGALEVSEDGKSVSGQSLPGQWV